MGQPKNFSRHAFNRVARDSPGCKSFCYYYPQAGMRQLVNTRIEYKMRSPLGRPQTKNG